MVQSKPVSGTLSTLLFLLYPLVGELLFLDTIIKDVFARQRIRVLFSLVGLGIVAIGFSASEILIQQAVLLGSPSYSMIPVEIRYSIVTLAMFLFLLLLIDEGWGGRVSLEEQISIPEDRISIRLNDPREIFTTLNRILKAAQNRRWRNPQSDNSRLAKYALTLLGEYLQTRIFAEPFLEE